jgi:riboflavin synthase
VFTGIVEVMGTVRSVEPRDRAVRLTIGTPSFGEGLAIGESVSVNGVCLTTVQSECHAVSFDVVEETLQRTSLGMLEAGSAVNLERPVSLSTRLGGHLVQGHVDAVGTVQSVERRGDELWIAIAIPAGLGRYIVEKGSIAVDGISLTVAAIDPDVFHVAIIPHTAEITNLGCATAGTRVNLEVDVIAKHIEKLAEPYLANRSH